MSDNESETEPVPVDPHVNYCASCNDCSWTGGLYDNPEQADYERQQHEESTGHPGYVQHLHS